MKKIFLILIFSHCVIMNPIGFGFSREKGDKAASRIRKAAVLHDIIYNGFPSIYSLLANDLKKIDPNRYYFKPEVDKCVNAIIRNPLFVGGIAYLIEYSCKLEPDNNIFDSPFPEL